MKKLFPDRRVLLSPSVLGIVFGPVLVAGITSCASQVVHWDAVQMRRHVNDYYNEEIMDNLIRAQKGLPFVHVDVASLSALSGAKIAATVAGGQTLNNTGTRVGTTTPGTNQIQTTTDASGATMSTVTTNLIAGAAGVASTITRMAMRPFTVSATPEQSDTLTIVSNPVVGNKSKNIYDAYLAFIRLPAINRRSSVFYTNNPAELKSTDYVPETLTKWRDGLYYYVPADFKADYARLCYNIVTAGRPEPAAAALQSAPVLIQAQ